MERLGCDNNDITNPASDYYQARLKAHLDYMRDLASLSGKDIDEYAETLLYDIDKIKDCDAIYLIRDWKESAGAKAEAHFAQAIGKVLLFDKYSHAGCYLSEKYHHLVKNGQRPLQREHGETDFDQLIRYVNSNINKIWIQASADITGF